MKYISEENLKKHIIHDNCDDGCGYLDERDFDDMEWVDEPVNTVLEKIKAEISKLKGTYPNEYYLKIIDKYQQRNS